MSDFQSDRGGSTPPYRTMSTVRPSLPCSPTVCRKAEIRLVWIQETVGSIPTRLTQELVRSSHFIRTDLVEIEMSGGIGLGNQARPPRVSYALSARPSASVGGRIKREHGSIAQWEEREFETPGASVQIRVGPPWKVNQVGSLRRFAKPYVPLGGSVSITALSSKILSASPDPQVGEAGRVTTMWSRGVWLSPSAS